MPQPLPIIQNNVQDRNCEAWKKLCQYIDRLAEEGSDEFSPREALGNELFAQIHTLPESIGKLKSKRPVNYIPLSISGPQFFFQRGGKSFSTWLTG